MQVIWEHMKSRRIENFDKASWYQVDDQFPYDYNSVMHYAHKVSCKEYVYFPWNTSIEKSNKTE